MALWDESATGAKCSNCGGNIFFDENFQKLSCRTCGSFFDPYSLELSYQLKVADKEKASDDDTRVEYTCDSCGADARRLYSILACRCRVYCRLH